MQSDEGTTRRITSHAGAVARDAQPCARSSEVPTRRREEQERSHPARAHAGDLHVAGGRRPHRADVDRPTMVSFHLEGTVDRDAHSAGYVAGVLTCGTQLRQRAEIVVGMGETFRLDDESPSLDATLDGAALPVLLTLMRAMSVVTRVSAQWGRATV